MKINNPNIIYNRILDFCGFLGTTLFVVAKMFEWTTRSWWWILFPIIVPGMFHVSEDEE